MDEARCEVVRRVFAMLGRRLEAGADIAAAGEAPELTTVQAMSFASQLALVAQDLATSADAVLAICSEGDGGWLSLIDDPSASPKSVR